MLKRCIVLGSFVALITVPRGSSVQAATLEPLTVAAYPQCPVSVVTVSSSGEFVLGRIDVDTAPECPQAMLVWSTSMSRPEVIDVNGLDGTVYPQAITDDGETIVGSVYQDEVSRAFIYRAGKGISLPLASSVYGSNRAADITPDGSRILAGAQDGIEDLMLILDERGEVLSSLSSTAKSQLNGVDLSADGAYVAGHFQNPNPTNCFRWEIDTDQLEVILPANTIGYGETCSMVGSSDDGSILASQVRAEFNGIYLLRAYEVPMIWSEENGAQLPATTRQVTWYPDLHDISGDGAMTIGHWQYAGSKQAPYQAALLITPAHGAEILDDALEARVGFASGPLASATDISSSGEVMVVYQLEGSVYIPNLLVLTANEVQQLKGTGTGMKAPTTSATQVDSMMRQAHEALSNPTGSTSASHQQRSR